MKTVAVVGTVGVPACYGGFESLVQNLVDYQSDDIQYQIFCSSKKYEKKMKNNRRISKRIGWNSKNRECK